MALVLNGTTNTIGTPALTDALLIDATKGALYKRVPAFCAAAVGLGHTVPSGGPGTAIYAYNTVILDNCSGFNTTTFRYTVPVTGWWIIFYHMLAGAVAGSSAGGTAVFVNGASIPGYTNPYPITRDHYNSGSSRPRWAYMDFVTNWSKIEAEHFVYLNAGDYIDVRSAEAGPHYYYAQDINGFGGHLVSAA